jgi:sulfoxide reductase heme-binding subunit YedZ
LTGSLVPLVVIGVRAASGQLGANPVATALNQLGLLALVLLIASLACTPLKIAFKWTWPMRIRRTLGLMAFFTALLHFSVYLIVDQGLSGSALYRDVTQRPFILVGFLALLMLLPLALTSTKKAVQRLGHAKWKRLHRLVYLAACLAVIHFVLRVKADAREPLVYAAVLAALLLLRLFDVLWRRMRPLQRARKVSVSSSG